VPSPSFGVAVGSVGVNVKIALTPPGMTVIEVIVANPETLLVDGDTVPVLHADARAPTTKAMIETMCFIILPRLI
jgi:hypothetical protein